MYLQSHIYKKYSSKFWFHNYLKSRSVFVFTLYISGAQINSYFKVIPNFYQYFFQYL